MGQQFDLCVKEIDLDDMTTQLTTRSQATHVTAFFRLQMVPNHEASDQLFTAWAQTEKMIT